MRISVVIDTEHPAALAVYCNGVLVWPSRDWVPSAPCRGLDVNEFVPEVADEPPDVVMQLCLSCPVRQACEDYGRASRSTGWWGGVPLGIGPRPRSKTSAMPWAQVVAIRRLHAEGVPPAQLVRTFHVGFKAISNIVTGKARAQQPEPGRMMAGPAKLTAEQVTEMRQRYAAGGVTLKELGRDYGVSYQNVGQIIKRQRWWHVP